MPSKLGSGINNARIYWGKTKRFNSSFDLLLIDQIIINPIVFLSTTILIIERQSMHSEVADNEYISCSGRLSGPETRRL